LVHFASLDIRQNGKIIHDDVLRIFVGFLYYSSSSVLSLPNSIASLVKKNLRYFFSNVKVGQFHDFSNEITNQLLNQFLNNLEIQENNGELRS
jgi:hypothetical protein